MWMDSAIKHAQTNVSELNEEKEEKLKKIEESLEKVKEHNPTSPDPFMTRPNTPDEQLGGCFATVIGGIIIGIIVILLSQ